MRDSAPSEGATSLLTRAYFYFVSDPLTCFSAKFILTQIDTCMYHPIEREAAMQPAATTPPEYPTPLVQPARRCTHSRIVDEVRNADGMKAGRLVCLECFAEFPDPDYQATRH